MRNYKLTIDLLDVYSDLSNYDIREFNYQFMLIFIEASDPDDACFSVINRIINAILKQDQSIEARILCRKIRKYIRFDKIEAL